jgi:3-oxoacyl-ACP reductase-like protein
LGTAKTFEAFWFSNADKAEADAAAAATAAAATFNMAAAASAYETTEKEMNASDLETLFVKTRGQRDGNAG